MRPNNALIYVIILQITFILLFIDKSELLKERINNIVPSDITTIIVVIIILCISHYIVQAIQSHYKINYGIIMIFICTNILIYIEYKMSPIHCKISYVDNMQIALDNSRTGDFVLLRSYNTSDLKHYALFRILPSIINGHGSPFFSHIGMIVKKNNVAYILETAEQVNYCIHANKLKSGIKLTNAYNRINKYHGRAYLSRNNLHNYIRDEDIIQFMDKYGHLLFFDDYIICITIICMFLQFVNVFKHERNYVQLYKLNDPELYSCDFKNIETVELKNKYYYDNLQNKL
jgi:hypothetical protein